MRLLIYLRRALVGLRFFVGGPQLNRALQQQICNFDRFCDGHSHFSAGHFPSHDDLVQFGVDGYQNSSFHPAILQAASLKRNGPLLPVLAGGNACE